jgi:hypothetical protein
VEKGGGSSSGAVERRTTTRDGMAAGVVLKIISSATWAERGKKGRGSASTWGQEKKGDGRPCAAAGSAGWLAAAPSRQV